MAGFYSLIYESRLTAAAHQSGISQQITSVPIDSSDTWRNTCAVPLESKMRKRIAHLCCCVLAVRSIGFDGLTSFIFM